MPLDIMKEKGVPVERQDFDWRSIIGMPFSKLDDDAFTRVRVILMNGIEMEAIRFSHSYHRTHNHDLRRALALTRRVEAHQQLAVNHLLPADHSVLETTLGYEQVAVEVTAMVAQQEPDPYAASVYRFGLLEDFDHLYRYSALIDRLEAKDANNILQSYTDVLPGRPTAEEHRFPHDDLRKNLDHNTAQLVSVLNALTILSGEQQTQNFYQNVGPLYADPVARLLYAEIASIEEQHVTQYGSLIDPKTPWMQRWLMHEVNEVYNYYSCVESESNPQVKAIWQRFLDYELGHVHMVMDLYKKVEKRDPAELLPSDLPQPLPYKSQRDYLRTVLANESDLRAAGTQFVPKGKETADTVRYRDTLNRAGSPSTIVAAGFRYMPGTELAEPAVARVTH